MSIASRVKWFLDVNRVRYEVVAHPQNPEADGASPAAIPPGKIAKAVLLADDAGYLMPILPEGRRLNLEKLRAELARDLKPATSEDVLSLFFDCDAGSIPAAGAAYGIPAIVDDELVGVDDIYFQGGDREDLVHMEGEVFFDLMADGKHAPFSVAS
jgi:Ala-tRNA(Pro) deacylase